MLEQLVGILIKIFTVTLLVVIAMIVVVPTQGRNQHGRCMKTTNVEYR